MKTECGVPPVPPPSCSRKAGPDGTADGGCLMFFAGTVALGLFVVFWLEKWGLIEPLQGDPDDYGI